MASLREIRRKIQSVKSTQQITRAMKMVAAARMRKAQNAILSSRPFAAKLEETVRELALLEVQADKLAGRVVQIHEFFDEPKADDSACLVLVTSDKGLCGAFNTAVQRAALAWFHRNQGKKLSVVLVGKKGRDLVRRLHDFHPHCLEECVGIFPKVTFAHAELIGKPIIDGFMRGDFATVTMIYNEFKSVVSQRVVQPRLLPIAAPELAEDEAGSPAAANPYGFHFEPDRQTLLAGLLPRYIKAQLFRVLLESQAAELAARMNAMDSATKNAGELLETLTLNMNRSRQAIITGEIAELVGGAEALKA
ncbi:MAG: ATP synthase F1 subunit gamma [Elusimicrobiota bacterium]